MDINNHHFVFEEELFQFVNPEACLKEALPRQYPLPLVVLHPPYRYALPRWLMA